MKHPGDSPLVDEVRLQAMEISKRFQHDLKAYGKYLKDRQKKHGNRVVSQITVVPERPNISE